MNLVEYFDNVSTDDCGYIVITEREIADLRYSLIDDEGGERIVPLRWHTFDVLDATLTIHAALYRPIEGATEVLVHFDYFKRVTSVEIVEDNSVGHYANWPMKSDMRGDLFQAVSVLARRWPGKWVVREWPIGSGNFNKWDVL